MSIYAACSMVSPVVLDDTHGFMRVEIEDDSITARYFAIPRPSEPQETPSRVADLFQLQFKANKLARRADGTLSAPARPSLPAALPSHRCPPLFARATHQRGNNAAISPL
jgi:hypothetical protein